LVNGFGVINGRNTSKLMKTGAADMNPERAQKLKALALNGHGAIQNESQNNRLVLAQAHQH
jgi:hypothetical protein